MMEREHRQTESRRGTCAGSVITGIHFSEVCINGNLLRRIVRAVQTAMADTVEITGICSEEQYERQLAGELTSNIFSNTAVSNVKALWPKIASYFKVATEQKRAMKKRV